MTLTELAERINKHLKRIERDPELNPIRKNAGNTRAFYYAAAYRGGQFCRVSYVSYQGALSLHREEAEKYLAWLDAGNNGTHYEVVDD